MPLPTAPRRGQWKGLALAGVALAGLMAGEAQAKWIKATVTGTVLTSATGYTLQAGNSIALNFYIQNYTSTGTNQWEQTVAKPNYTQLFNYATGTGTTGISGNYNASLPPSSDSSIFQSGNNGSDFLLRVSGNPSSGLAIGGGGAIQYISLGGTLSNFSSTWSSGLDVVDFISAAGNLGSPYSCTPNCSGVIQPTSNEDPITFTWNNIQFDQIEPVPAPLPIVGALAAFSFSRKLRTRLASR
jgi:hypothetical protein